MSDYNKLSPDFIAELVKSCLTNSKILAICKEHLKFQFLETEPQKKVVKYIFDYSDVNDNTTPTIGMIGQTFATDKETIKFLANIKKVDFAKGDEEGLLDTLEKFIKTRRLIILHQDQFPEMFNAGKQEEAAEFLREESDAISKFSLRQKYYATIFGDYEQRQDQRILKGYDKIMKTKCPFGIHEIDDHIYGGGSIGTSALILARSGVGKTTFGRWIGLSNARLGKRVVHFFAEGTEDEHKDAYDAAWTSAPLREVEVGIIDDNLAKKITKVRQHILASGGEIIIVCVEDFEAMYIEDCFTMLKDIERSLGKVHVAIFDYLEEFEVRGKFVGESGERKRRLKCANRVTAIATSLKLFAVAFTQANDIKPEKWNNPDYVLTRSDISEFKGVLKPFSYFLTLNQTRDEKKEGIMRIYEDKYRKYPDGKTIYIYQSMENARFYDSQKTLNSFYSKVNV